jgi:hypothetical protein
VRYSRKLKPALYRHTHAHLDKYLPDHMHTQDQRSNILADHAAGLSEEHAAWIQDHYPQLTKTSTSFQAVHEALLTDIPLCVTNGSTPSLSSLHNTFSKQNFAQYISDRLTKTAHGHLYRDASYSFCTEVFDLTKADITQRASAVRLIFDKVWQPWNIRKYKRQAAPLCPHCEVEDSLGHMLRDCTHPNIHNLRKSAVESARKVVSEGDELIHAVFDAMLEVIQEDLGESIWRGLWLPQHVESFRTKLAQANIISLDPNCILYDSPRARELHAATLDIAKILGQAALNMMRERNAMAHDANFPLQATTAGKTLPPPLALYSNQKKFRKKAKAKAPPARLTTRVTSMHPPFVREKRTHPRILAQALKLAEAQVRAAAAADIALDREEQAAIVYAEPFPVVPEVIQPWDSLAVPYLELPEPTDRPMTAGEISELEIRQIANQAERAHIFEDIMQARRREEAAERRRIEALASWNDPENMEARRHQVHRRGHLSRASIEARAAERQRVLEQHNRPQCDPARNTSTEPRVPREDTQPVQQSDPNSISARKDEDTTTTISEPTHQPCHRDGRDIAAGPTTLPRVSRGAPPVPRVPRSNVSVHRGPRSNMTTDFQEAYPEFSEHNQGREGTSADCPPSPDPCRPPHTDGQGPSKEDPAPARYHPEAELDRDSTTGWDSRQETPEERPTLVLDDTPGQLTTDPSLDPTGSPRLSTLSPGVVSIFISTHRSRLDEGHLPMLADHG